ncbi:MAG: endolytic transglycosylase MltG [Patescibacteria group bacterium]|nr:endolytic transglycosylase MltG [Patescibacteria group bacterium]
MKKKKIILIFIIFALSLIAIGIGSFIYIQNIISRPYNSEDNIKREFVIQSGQGVKQISANLENENLIAGKDYFEIYVWQKELANKLQAGTYDLSPSMTIAQMVDIFVGGKIRGNEIKITIPEGFSNSEIDEKLSKSGLIIEGEFINFDKNIKQFSLSKYEFLRDRPEGAGLQGYYFPDTYIYYSDSSMEDVAVKMLDNFDEKLTSDLRKEIKRQNKTIFEVIILASIVEKEAGYVEDMKKVASVFQNRLDIGKALESDATVNYITNSGRSQSTYEDLKIDSPYNTYKYTGLIPGPISNPGIEAIKAVIYPEKTDYFYFLTKKGDNRAVFSKTYQEHLENKNKYLN